MARSATHNLEIKNMNKLSFYRTTEGYRWRTTDPGNHEITGASTQAFSRFIDCRDNYRMVSTAAMDDALSLAVVDSVEIEPKELTGPTGAQGPIGCEGINHDAEAIKNLTCAVRDPLEGPTGAQGNIGCEGINYDAQNPDYKRLQTVPDPKPYPTTPE